MQLNKVSEVNATRVLQKIWLSDGTTRGAIASELGLVKSTVSRIVTMLLDQGIVLEREDRPTNDGVGRRSVPVEINKEYGIILGLEIQTDFFDAVAINLRGEIVGTWSDRLSMGGKDVATAFREIMARLKDPIAACRVPLIGVGVGVAGVVDQHSGSIVQSNPLNITTPVRFIDDIRDDVPVPVIVENDANCCCWGELAFRKTSRHNNFLFVLGEFRAGEAQTDLYWGIAIGLGLVLNGTVYHGAAYSAGEFQSILWKPGNEGQLSITNEEASRIKSDKSVMEKALQELCAHLAFLVNSLNLTAVVFGGEIIEYRDDLLPMLRGEIQRNWSYPNEVVCAIEFSSLSRHAVSYGAAGMFLESVFSIPEMFSTSGPTKRSQISILRD
ncbi:MAG: ROK family transcriptional regulator [Spirochaetaceae bacterium]|nr:MAG: ROK family transcriptional regulator [Spirochaetaceae bacterium]